MDRVIIDLQHWLQTPTGQRVKAWEQVRFDEALADVFGYHALQLGLPAVAALASNRMPHQWLAVGDAKEVLGLGAGRTAFATDFSALPFAENSLDLVVMPHALEFCSEPHAALREVARVLVPEGRLVLTGFNPASLWGLRQARQRLFRSSSGPGLFLPEEGEFISYSRLRDWLRLLSFEVETGQFGLYGPAAQSEKWLQRFDWLDRIGERWWPRLGAVYCVVAVKRVRGMRILAPLRRKPVFSNAPVSVANKDRGYWTYTEFSRKTDLNDSKN